MFSFVFLYYLYSIKLCNVLKENLRKMSNDDKFVFIYFPWKYKSKKVANFFE